MAEEDEGKKTQREAALSLLEGPGGKRERDGVYGLEHCADTSKSQFKFYSNRPRYFRVALFHIVSRMHSLK